MHNGNNNLALKYGFGDQSQIGPNSDAYKTRMGALKLPDPVSGNAVAGATTNNQKLGTSPDPRFNAATQAANNLQFNSGGQQSSGLPKQGFGSSSGWLPGGLSQDVTNTPYSSPWEKGGDWYEPETEIHTIGSQFGADASVAAGWGQNYSVDVEAERLPWYNNLPAGTTPWESSGYAPPKPMPVDEDWGQRMMNTQYAQSMGKKRDEEIDAARRDPFGEGTDYSAGVHSRTNTAPSGQPGSSDYDPIEAGDLSTTMGGADNLANYGDEYSDFSSKATADKTDYPSFWDSNETGVRFSKKQVAENIARAKQERMDEWTKVVQDKYGKPVAADLEDTIELDKVGGAMEKDLRSQALRGPTEPTADDWFSQNLSAEEMDAGNVTGATPGFNEQGGMIDYNPNPEANPEAGTALGATLGEAWGKFDKTFESIGGGGTVLAAGAKVVGDILQSGKNKGMQDDLRGMRKDVESAVGTISNLKYAGQQAQEAIHGEERRMAGGEGNIVLGNVLNKIREISEGGLKSGSKSRLINKSIEDSQTKTDIILADSYNKHLDKMSGIQEESVSERSILNEKLTEIDRQIAALDDDWMETALDVGQIAVTGMNPAFGIAYAGARTLTS